MNSVRVRIHRKTYEHQNVRPRKYSRKTVRAQVSLSHADEYRPRRVNPVITREDDDAMKVDTRPQAGPTTHAVSTRALRVHPELTVPQNEAQLYDADELSGDRVRFAFMSRLEDGKSILPEPKTFIQA
jgi:hypothetical protein